MRARTCCYLLPLTEQESFPLGNFENPVVVSPQFYNFSFIHSPKSLNRKWEEMLLPIIINIFRWLTNHVSRETRYYLVLFRHGGGFEPLVLRSVTGANIMPVTESINTLPTGCLISISTSVKTAITDYLAPWGHNSYLFTRSTDEATFAFSRSRAFCPPDER